MERPAPQLRLREARAPARCLPRTPAIPGGLAPPHLLIHQHHDLACRRRTALPGIPHPVRHAVETIGHLVAQCTPPSSTNDGFVGMTEYVPKSFHDLLAGESESPSDSDTSRGSHPPSRECFMAGTPEGYIESIHEEVATPTDNARQFIGDD